MRALVTDKRSILPIQYLRAVAALMVVAHHAEFMVFNSNTTIQFGASGVDIFFVISGFIMAYSTRDFNSAFGKIEQATTFLKKRFIRIAPLYWIASLWTIKMDIVRGQLSWNLALDFLFYPRLHSNGNIWPQLIVGWTINYEVFFYIIFGIGMLWGARRYFFIFSAMIFLVILGLFLAPTSPAFVFYSSQLQLEFILGIIIYFIHSKYSIQNNYYATAGIVAATFLMAWGAHSEQKIIINGISAGLLVWSCLTINSNREFKLPMFLGTASYSIYLFHLGVFSLISKIPHTLFFETGYFAVLILTAVGAGVGSILYLVIEKPMLKKLTAGQ